MELLHLEEVFHPEDTATTLEFSLQVPEGQKALEIHLDYSPKKLEDTSVTERLLGEGFVNYQVPVEAQESMKKMTLTNLLTVSLWSPEQYVGAVHRGDNHQRLFVSAEKSTEGFHAHDMAEGTWTLTLHFHSIFTSECAVNLKVFARKEWEA